jgi:hypothetical protein
MEISKNIKDIREFIGKIQQKTQVDKGLVDYFNLFVDTYRELNSRNTR